MRMERSDWFSRAEALAGGRSNSATANRQRELFKDAVEFPCDRCIVRPPPQLPTTGPASAERFLWPCVADASCSEIRETRDSETGSEEGFAGRSALVAGPGVDGEPAMS